jgi:hypothetical protein
MQGTAGNVAIVARETVMTPIGVRSVPFLSGNAMRHRAVREPGMLWLIHEYGLAGNLRLSQLNFLLHGGNLTESTATENTNRIAEAHRLWPLLRLCGGCLSNQILSGSLIVTRGTLVCEENRQSIKCIPDEPLLSAESMIHEYQYTRGNAANLAIHEETVTEDASTQMIFSGQAVARGSWWQHGFIIRSEDPVLIGALLWSLRLWQESGGTIGGQGSRGHGHLRLHIVDPPVDIDNAIGAYVDYARSVKEEAVDWIKEAWKK